MYERIFAAASASITGPTSVPGSRGSPTTSARVASTRRWRNTSYALSRTITRLHAEHFWPWKPKALWRTPSTASSRSALSSMIRAFLPPISQTTFLTNSWPSRGSPAALMMSRPTALLPVNAISATRGSRTSAAPTVSPGPGRKCSTSRGTPAAHRMSQSTLAMAGVCSAGFTTAVLPVTSAATVMPQQMANGKFHGLITAATPRGWYHCSSSSPTKLPRRWRANSLVDSRA